MKAPERRRKERRNKRVLWQLVHNPRRILRIAQKAITLAMMTVAAAAHIGGAVSMRTATLIMHPLVEEKQLTPAEASAVGNAFALLLFLMIVGCGYWKMDRHRLGDAKVPPNGVRVKTLRRMERVPRFRSVAHRARLKDRRYPWVLAVVPYLVFLFFNNYLAQEYTKRIPFAAGNALTALGPLTMSLVLAAVSLKASGFSGTVRHWREYLNVVVPAMSATGALLMVPWGDHIDPVGVIIALSGAITSAGMVAGSKAMAHSGIIVKGTAISMLVGVGFSLPFLLDVQWTHAVIKHGVYAGVATAVGLVAYNLAAGPLKLPTRMMSLLAGNGPAFSYLTARIELGQRPHSVGGMVVMLVSSSIGVFSATPKERNNEAKEQV